MGEPTCLMQQQPFSYVAGIPNESNEGNPLHVLGQSVSFGRFMSESLAWEKWSSFSNNRYVEEAERFSRPGSVAQKKAFFEAHYKNLAARKAAALLEQANSAAEKNETEVQDDNAVQVQDSGEVNTNSQLGLDYKQVDVKETINAEASVLPNDDVHNLLVEMPICESRKLEEVDTLTENPAVGKDSVNFETLTQFGVADSEEEVKEREITGSKLMEKPLLKDFISTRDDLTLMGKKKLQICGKASRMPSTPAKPAASVRAKKENNSTPISKKCTIDALDKKKSTPKSTHKSMNFTPVRGINKITSSVIRKIDNSIMGSNYKASKDCTTPLKTPTMVPVLREPKHTLATPQSEDRRARTPLHPLASGSKTVRSRWHFLPTDCSNFMSARKNKSQSPNLSTTPFSFRTEERAARRKEKLEEKFNANQAQKVQLQATLKSIFEQEKAETEIKKLRQTLCFKARPLPDFYRERAKKNPIEKVPLTHSQSPNLARTPSPSIIQRTSQPSLSYSFKNGGPKHGMGKNGGNLRSLTSRLRSITRENTSPNIQYEQHKVPKKV
ncbi:protein WVD2-like 7 isoform X2 [Jatropha curcas]|uniref:protein WVD2-like 7 isoform X2 n=1 Tax=Jatropha curcas TaxID=180498 RepID=UPI0005FAF4C5|nr:protein WVD2-like 7 isoform X2 [Jatropha curcas]